MHGERLKLVEDTFHEAIARPPAERTAYLDEICKSDVELRREVESLLAETAMVQEFLETPVAPLALAAGTLLEGRDLGHYRIGELIGSGGMAEVYRAHDLRLDRDVAIKVLHDVQLADPRMRDRVYREARLLATLNHPNIASIYGLEENGPICGLVLELVEGDTLSERISRGPMPLSIVKEFARQIGAGLEVAHAKGIIHRDLKPSNIKITSDGTIKIVDFGVAKLLQTLDKDRTVDDISTRGLIVGTPAYMSPEQARGKAVDARTDIWAFGCVLYEMLAGKPAFQGETPTDVIIKIAKEDPDWTSISRSSEARAFLAIIRRCIQKDPELRYGAINQIVADLVKCDPVPDPPAPFVPQMPGVFLAAQFGYLALYAAALYHIEAIGSILSADFLIPEPAGLIATVILAMCGIAVRIYLISAVGWRHPAAGRKFHLLFPLLLLLDGVWAASPLLLARKIGYGPALIGAALLAYVPFAQRTLVRGIYHEFRSN